MVSIIVLIILSVVSLISNIQLIMLITIRWPLYSVLHLATLTMELG